MSAAVFLSSTILSKTTHFSPKNQDSSNPNSNPNSRSISSQPTSGDHEKYHKFKPNPSVSATRTAPWMKGPLVLEPNQILDFSKPKNKKKSSDNKDENPQDSLTHKVSGGRGKQAMKKILHGIDNLEEENQESEGTQKKMDQIQFDFSLGRLDEESLTRKVSGGREKRATKKVWHSFSNLEEENQELDNTQKRLEQIEFDLSLGEGGGGGTKRFLRQKMPWEREERMVFRRTKREKVVTAAELTLDGVLLERLRGVARKMRNWVKVKKAGVSEGVIEQIRMIWKTDELAMLKFDLPLCRNMDRAREIVEIKTGGLVIWSRKDIHVVYRGHNYKSFPKKRFTLNGSQEFSSSKTRFSETMPVQGSLFERESDRLLDGLGPRYVDWWMPKPLPIDADLLPEVVPGYKPPLRKSVMNSTSKLRDDELTYLRKLAYPLPTHFVLGRNKNLQGLAVAILKLWEKCHIAKIAVKWGIPNTNNEQMATELKLLTGGVLLLRNKFYIILYRGKDFLPPQVADLVSNREIKIESFQLQEESARINTTETFCYTDEPSDLSTVGTLAEFKVIQSEHLGFEAGQLSEAQVQLEAEKSKLEKEIRNQQRKLFILKMKIKKASKELEKLDSAWNPVEPYEDRETITDEERECFRKMGLKMDSSLLLGRRGVFDGVMEGLHQHWKHRELVKVITMQRAFSKILYTAQCLEAESGGILVSIEKLKEGHGIIIYRGKNYKRPLKFPRHLLNKKEALRKSLEMQRIGSLKFFANMRQQAIYELKCKLAELLKSQN